MPTTIHKEEVRRLIESGAYLVEVLTEKQYQEVHLAQAVNIPLAQLSRERVAHLKHETPIIAYCNDYQ